ncbi:hypothetical protein O6H91_18G070400 [Diphasiastrum complanatum]|nr:hypothetical protein O6H91_18G070400 [Diphasiastrum complanatum]
MHNLSDQEAVPLKHSTNAHLSSFVESLPPQIFASASINDSSEALQAMENTNNRIDRKRLKSTGTKRKRGAGIQQMPVFEINEVQSLSDHELDDAEVVDNEVGSERKKPAQEGAIGLSQPLKLSEKKNLPAKNLLAERRRRKKLNDRLYMLRSVVPNISKMDRASILVDAIEYLKDLLHKIDDLQNELETQVNVQKQSSPGAPQAVMSPTSSSVTCSEKEDCLSSAPSKVEYQPPKIEVSQTEGNEVNIHMSCTKTPEIFLSILGALDDLGLDVQQAVINCYQEFSLDIFRAEQTKEDVNGAEEIKTVLLRTANLPNN